VETLVKAGLTVLMRLLMKRKLDKSTTSAIEQALFERTVGRDNRELLLVIANCVTYPHDQVWSSLSFLFLFFIVRKKIFFFCLLLLLLLLLSSPLEIEASGDKNLNTVVLGGNRVESQASFFDWVPWAKTSGKVGGRAGISPFEPARVTRVPDLHL